jgi:hypothetical protein
VRRVVDAVRDVDVSQHPMLVLAGPVAAMMLADRESTLTAFDQVHESSDPWTRAALLLIRGLLAENGGQLHLARDLHGCRGDAATPGTRPGGRGDRRLRRPCSGPATVGAHCEWREHGEHPGGPEQ